MPVRRRFGWTQSTSRFGEIFKDASGHIEKCTQEVTATLTSTEKQIQETEMICKKLAETSSVDAGPATHRSSQHGSHQSAADQTTGNIRSDHNNRHRLRPSRADQPASANRTHPNARPVRNRRTPGFPTIGLASMRDAIQEALAAIQSSARKSIWNRIDRLILEISSRL